jgi:DNA-binding Lrp family transcriptional regulator
MPPVDRALAGWGLDATDQRLVAQLQRSLPLSERPFAEVGAVLGLTEDAVIERLHRLLATGVLRHFGPLYSDTPDPAEPAFAALQVPQADLWRDVITATRSGLPLLPRPYEAVGAMVGASGEQVRAQLAQMLAQGLICRIGVVLTGDEDPPCDDTPA